MVVINMKKYRILVFPCGSEIALEIHRSLRHSTHIDLIGANSVDDHGRYIYGDYIGGVPFIDDADSIDALREIVSQRGVDAIYPAMDKVIFRLKACENELGCKVISSSLETTRICLSKSKTYTHLNGRVKIPCVYSSVGNVRDYPVFIKPDVGYGARGTYKADNAIELAAHWTGKRMRDCIITEYLPGLEYTVDCFTDRRGTLRFVGPRGRNRISNGISVNTSPIKDGLQEFRGLAKTINNAISFRGAWFFQVKRDKDGQLTLLEIASRLGGSSGLYRAVGVNFALLSVFDAFDIDVSIEMNSYDVEMDRALDNRYKTNLSYSTVYIDLDDTIILNGKVNIEIIAFLYKCINEGKFIVLITRHAKDLQNTLAEYRLGNIFDQVIHLKPTEEKSAQITRPNSIFVDDSFTERKKVSSACGIPVFDAHMVDVLFST